MDSLFNIRKNFKEKVTTLDKVSIAILFFIWGVLTQLTDLVVPILYKFGLEFKQALLLYFTFFATYFIIAFPAGKLVNRVGYKKSILVGLALAGFGCMIFYLAATVESYQGFVSALIIIASGVTLLQISGNGYVLLQSNPLRDASNLTFAQSINSFGRIITLAFGSFLFFSFSSVSPDKMQSMSPDEYKKALAGTIEMPYLIMFVLIAFTMFVFYKSNLPEFKTHNLPVLVKKQIGTYQNVFEIRHLVLGALAIFAYVGAEVSIGTYLIDYVTLSGLGYKSITENEMYELLLYYWGSAFAGRIIGGFILRDMQPGKVVAGFSIVAAAFVIASVLTNGQFAVMCILAVGFFNSILFPTIFSLALKGLGNFSEQGASVLVASIVGGALIPLVVISSAQFFTLKISFIIPAICYLYVLYYGAYGSKYEVLEAKA